MKIYELMALAGEETPQQRAAAQAYEEGLVHWRRREFAATVACFARTSSTDKPSALFLKRASEFAKRPPGLGWEPVNSLESK